MPNKQKKTAKTVTKTIDLISNLPAMPSPRRRGGSIFPPTAPMGGTRTPEDSDEDNPAPKRPTVVFSPVKTRRRNQENNKLKNLPDMEAWEYDDAEIITAAFSGLKAPVYQHFTVSLERVKTPLGKPRELVFVFTCNADPDHHAPHRRSRLKTASGTSNLVAGAKACDRRLGIAAAAAAKASSSLQYSPANHRTLLALRCARNMRPFNFVQDTLYQVEVEMLRPGTRLPDPTTISRDVKLLYEHLAPHVSSYFKSLNCALHVVVDGWTAPITASFLGVVVVWCDKGLLHRAVLEFIRLKKKHTGKYLAEEIAGCLKRYDICDLFFSLAMDNASNCNTTAVHMPVLIPTFLGEKARIRCFSHILHLIAQMFMSFFFKKRKPSKKLKTKPDGAEELVDVDDDEDVEPGDDVVQEEIDAEDAELADDDGSAAYSKAAVYSMRDEAISLMEEEGVIISSDEMMEALTIMPKVAGLARRVHDSAVLKESFDELVGSDPAQNGLKRTLDRRVATRWNSDHACLKAHLHFRKQVEQLTGLTQNKLHAYRLTEDQWNIAEELVEALAIFEVPTRLFSAAEVPLIVDVLPAFDDLRISLKGLRDYNEAPISPVLKVAAQAALLMVDKYERLSWDCDIYYVAIVMCPDRKLQWFKDRKYDKPTMKYIRDLVLARFKDGYDTGEDQGEVEQQPSRFVRTVNQPVTQKKYGPDHIETYLKDAPLPTSVIRDAGGYLKYWHNAMANRPSLAKMGLDFCSTPASSVDAERAFSIGRRQVNFMQHNMTPNTFKAKMALGSWYDQPFFPKLQKLSTVIEKKSSGEMPDEEFSFSSDSDSE